MLRTLATTKSTLRSEVEWFEGLVEELIHFSESGSVELPPCLTHYAEVCERMSFYVSLVAGTLQSFHQEISEGTAEESRDARPTESREGGGGVEAFATRPLSIVFSQHKSDASLLQELLLDATPQPYTRTVMHAASSLISIALAILKSIAPEVVRFGSVGEDGSVTWEGSMPDNGSELIASPNGRTRIPQVLQLAISLTHILSNTIHFMKEIAALISTAASASPPPGAPINSTLHSRQRTTFIELTRSLFFQGGVCESLVEVFAGNGGGRPAIMQCLAAMGADVAHPSLGGPQSSNPSFSACVLINDEGICDRIRSAAAETLFLVIETCGVEVATRSCLITTMFSDEAHDSSQTRHWRYSVTNERSETIRRSVLGMLGSLVRADPIFYLSLVSQGRSASFPRLLMKIIRSDSNIRKGDEARSTSQREQLSCELDTQALATNTLTHLIACALHKFDIRPQGHADADHLSIDASAFDRILCPSRADKTHASSDSAKILWKELLRDIEGFGKVVLINLHLCHRILTSPNTRRLTSAREQGHDNDFGNTGLVVSSCVDLIDSTITLLAAAAEFYNSWGVVTGESSHAITFYQYCHRVHILEHLVVLLSRSQASTSDSRTSSYFMVPSPRVVYKAARMVRYFIEHAPPSVALIPASLLGCDSSTNVIICALEPTSFQGRRATVMSSAQPSGLGGVFGDDGYENSDDDASVDEELAQSIEVQKVVQDDSPSVRYFRRAQFETALSLILVLARSPLNRRTYYQFLREQLTPVVCPEAVPRPSYNGALTGFAAPGAALSQQTRDHLKQICTRAFKKGSTSVIAAVVRQINNWVRVALSIDVSLASTSSGALGALRGMLVQDDTGRCLNDPFNFPEGWSTDEIIKERLLRSTALVSMDLRSRTGSSIQMPTIGACSGFNPAFAPTRTSVEGVVDAQEMRHFMDSPSDEKGGGGGQREEQLWRSNSYWNSTLEPLRRHISWNALQTTDRDRNPQQRPAAEQHSVASVVAQVYGILAAALFSHVLGKIVLLARHKSTTAQGGDSTKDSFLTEVSPIHGGAHRRSTAKESDSRFHFFDRDGNPWNAKKDGVAGSEGDYEEDNDSDLDDFVAAVTAAEDRNKVATDRKVDLPSTLLQTEFDAAFNLAVDMSDHYHKKVVCRAAETSTHRAPFADPSVASPSRLGTVPVTTLTVYNRSKTGLVCGYKKNAIDTTRMKYGPTSTDPRLLHHGHEAQSKLNMRAWTVKAVQEGDLFFLSIPLQALTSTVVEAIVAKARAHQSEAKKAFLTTPTHRRERRWFLYDLHTCVMPRIIAVLQRLNKFCSSHGSQHVQMSISMLPCLKFMASTPFINTSNLVQVVDFLSQYFNKTSIGAPSSYHEGLTVDGVSLADGGDIAGSFRFEGSPHGGGRSPLQGGGHYDPDAAPMTNQSFYMDMDTPMVSSVDRSKGSFQNYLQSHGGNTRLGTHYTPQAQRPPEGGSGGSVSLAGIMAARAAAKLMKSRLSSN